MENSNKTIIPKRINNLAFEKASYLGKEPSYPSWHIDYWYSNGYYGEEKNFIKVNKDYYAYPDMPNCKVSVNCFKHKECSVAICTFVYNEKEECYELEFVGDRPITYLSNSKIDQTIFFNLIKYGFEQLNPQWYKEGKED